MAIDKELLNRLHRESRALLEGLADRLSEKDLKRLRTYSDVGEWLLLVDGICANLVQDQIPITRREREALASVLAMAATDDPNHPYLQDPDQTLSSLRQVE